MTVDLFNKMSQNERAELLFSPTSKAQHVDEWINYSKLRYSIYHLCSFYIRVIQLVGDDPKIIEINALKSLDDWEEYLKSINLNSLF